MPGSYSMGMPCEIEGEGVLIQAMLAAACLLANRWSDGDKRPRLPR